MQCNALYTVTLYSRFTQERATSDVKRYFFSYRHYVLCPVLPASKSYFIPYMYLCHICVE